MRAVARRGKIVADCGGKKWSRKRPQKKKEQSKDCDDRDLTPLFSLRHSSSFFYCGLLRLLILKGSSPGARRRRRASRRSCSVTRPRRGAAAGRRGLRAAQDAA